jgi:hypothetical protein
VVLALTMMGMLRQKHSVALLEVEAFGASLVHSTAAAASRQLTLTVSTAASATSSNNNGDMNSHANNDKKQSPFIKETSNDDTTTITAAAAATTTSIDEIFYREPGEDHELVSSDHPFAPPLTYNKFLTMQVSGCLYFFLRNVGMQQQQQQQKSMSENYNGINKGAAVGISCYIAIL